MLTLLALPPRSLLTPVGKPQRRPSGHQPCILLIRPAMCQVALLLAYSAKAAPALPNTSSPGRIRVTVFARIGPPSRRAARRGDAADRDAGAEACRSPSWEATRGGRSRQRWVPCRR